MNAVNTSKKASVGVQQLIEKLRDQGINDGKKQADTLINDAKKQAEQILTEAKEQAKSIVEKARNEADFITKSGKESLKMAERNAILSLKDYLIEELGQQITAIVSQAMGNDDLLKQMIIEISSDNKLSDKENTDLILPKKIIGTENLTNKDLVKKGSLLEFISQQTQYMLARGVNFKVDDINGLSFHLKDKGVEVQLTDESVSAILLKHLQPRFRVMLEGIEK